MTNPSPGEDQRDRTPSSSNLPVPDPTVLTTQLVDRALHAYRELVEVRLTAMDKATELLADNIKATKDAIAAETAHYRDDRDRQILALREILEAAIGRSAAVAEEKFVAIGVRFQERDERTKQAAEESRISLNAALAAAKEAVSEQNRADTEAIRKSDLATQKQIDSLTALMTTANKAVEDKITDLRTRLDRGEATTVAVSDTHTERRLDVGQMLVAASVLVAVIGVIITLLLTRGAG